MKVRMKFLLGSRDLGSPCMRVWCMEIMFSGKPGDTTRLQADECSQTAYLGGRYPLSHKQVDNFTVNRINFLQDVEVVIYMETTGIVGHWLRAAGVVDPVLNCIGLLRMHERHKSWRRPWTS